MRPTTTSLLASAAALLLVNTACSSDGSASGTAAEGIDVPSNIADAGVLRISGYFNYPPYRYLDKIGEPAGLEVKMANAVADKLGVDVKFENVPLDAIFPSITAKRYDFSLGAFQDTEERRKQVDIFDWFESSYRVMVLDGNPHGVDPSDLCGVSFSSVTGGIEVDLVNQIADECEAAGKPKPTQIILNDFAPRTLALINDRVQAFLTEPVVGTYIAEQYKGKAELLPEAIPGQTPVPTGWVFPKDATELEVAIVEAIRQLTEEGTWTKLMESAGLGETAIIPPTINTKPVGGSE